MHCFAAQLGYRDVSFEVDNDESIQIGMHGHYTKGNVDLRYGVSCHFDEPIVMRANDVILDADVIRDAKSWHYTEVNSGLRSGVQPLHESASLAQDEADVLLQVDANMDISTRYGLACSALLSLFQAFQTVLDTARQSLAGIDDDAVTGRSGLLTGIVSPK